MHPYYLKQIEKFVNQNDRVLDLGCGNGDLLASLKESHHIKGYGVDFKITSVLNCLKKGLSIYHGDIEDGIHDYQDKSFDIVILSQTLQQIKNPIELLLETIRVGKKAIITFPNFGHWRMRWQLLNGAAPQSKELPFSWYNTPNIRVITMKDFKKVCKEQNIKIIKEVPLYYPLFLEKVIPKTLSNLLSRKAMFIIEKHH